MTWLPRPRAGLLDHLRRSCGAKAGARVLDQQHLYSVYMHVGSNERDFQGELIWSQTSIVKLLCGCVCGYSQATSRVQKETLPSGICMSRVPVPGSGSGCQLFQGNLASASG